MNQMCYNIYDALQQKKHVREIARQIKSNQMTVSRKLKLLQKENIIDYMEEGRNKYYFRKKSIESQLFEKQTEIAKATKFVKDNPQFRSLIEEILHNKEISFAVIFGSYAKNSSGKLSDLDVFCENISQNVKKELELLNAKVSIKTGQFNSESALGKEIAKKYIILKGVDTIDKIHKKVM